MMNEIHSLKKERSHKVQNQGNCLIIFVDQVMHNSVQEPQNRKDNNCSTIQNLTLKHKTTLI